MLLFVVEHRRGEPCRLVEVKHLQVRRQNDAFYVDEV
jgi:hypothetical protein